jgi:hypothetical protein
LEGLELLLHDGFEPFNVEECLALAVEDEQLVTFNYLLIHRGLRAAG